METMNVKDFDFDLPQELIAQDPLEDRSASRLLVLDKNTGEMEHRHFRDITEYLRPGDCLVINNTKVIPARLFGVKEDTQAKIEVLLLKRRENDIWETLVKPGKKCKPGTVIVFGEGLLKGTVIDVVEEGNRLIQFSYEGIFEEILDQLGQMPLPPYITHQLKDKNRYQTVYAEHDGSAAAPTAGLHFTKELLAQIEAMGSGWTEIFIYPGYKFKILDCLITNFHLPESTLVMLVSALAGREHILNAYNEAIKERYRFFSFGDAMFIHD